LRKTAAVGVALALAAGAGPAIAADRVGSCAPGLGVGLVDVPKGTKDPRAQTYVVDHVRPGATLHRRYQVCNGTRQPMTVRLYAGAAAVNSGAFRVVEGYAGNELSRWITVNPGTITVAPGQRLLAEATITVPTDATQGERYAALLAELPPRRGPGGVQVANRVGVRVYLDVGTGGAPVSDFRVDSLQASRTADGTPVVTAQVHNTGARALDMTGGLRLSNGPGGLSGGPFPAELGTTLAPGDTEPVTVVLDRAISGGPWTATLTLKSGLLERRAQAQISFPVGSGAAAEPVPAREIPLAQDRKILVPLAWGLIFLLALLLLVIGLLTSRRRAESDSVDERLHPVREDLVDEDGGTREAYAGEQIGFRELATYGALAAHGHGAAGEDGIAE
jgi:hypothetical protein